MPICTTHVITQRVSLEELKELVDEPLSKTAVVLEFDKNERDQMAEEDLHDFLIKHFGVSDLEGIRNLPEPKRQAILQAVHHHGISIRRLAQLTGLTPYTIHKSIR